MDNEKKSLIEYLVTALAFIISVLAYIHNRRTFLLTTATNRAKIVTDAWKSNNLARHGYKIEDKDWVDWTDVVSELVITINVLQKIAGPRYIRWILGYKDVLIVFWEQTPTELRTKLKIYSSSDYLKKAEETNDVNVFREQMQDIIKCFKQVTVS